MRRILKSKKFWGGAATGMIAGPFLLGKLQQITGVSLGLPTIGGGGGGG